MSNSQHNLDDSTYEWPGVRYETLPWTPRGVASQALSHQRGSYEAAITPRIAHQQMNVTSDVQAESEDAALEMARFDGYAHNALRRADEDADLPLLHCESLASSRIEHLDVSAEELSSAALGRKCSDDTRFVIGNVAAMRTAAALSGDMDTEAMLSMQHSLMEHGSPDIAGKIRESQVWIGRSGLGPHLADFVPPHHDRVRPALDDLSEFCARDDLPVIVQTAVAHAQFETIHPFADGNGRTGRAMVHSMLRDKDVAPRITVPFSAGLLTDTRSYFDALHEYRLGNVEPIIRRFNAATFTAIGNARALVDDLDTIRRGWGHRLEARSHSVAWKVIDALIGQPVIDNRYVMDRFGVSAPSSQAAIDRLVEARILDLSSHGQRNRVWRSTEVLDALDVFSARAAKRSFSW